jgi:hypothetical protein
MMRDKFPLLITEAEVWDAALRRNCEFFANLIRYQQPIDPVAREVAADIVLKVFSGEYDWHSKSAIKKARTVVLYSDIADRVAELKNADGLESAINSVAHNLAEPGKRPPIRTVWKAWQIHCAQQRSVEARIKKVQELRALG